MNNKESYDLDFYQALKIVVEGGAVRGENFVDGIFLKLNSYGQLVIVDACRVYIEETKVFLTSLSYQKFRRVDIWTVKELSY